MLVNTGESLCYGVHLYESREENSTTCIPTHEIQTFPMNIKAILICVTFFFYFIVPPFDLNNSTVTLDFVFIRFVPKYSIPFLFISKCT